MTHIHVLQVGDREAAYKQRDLQIGVPALATQATLPATGPVAHIIMVPHPLHPFKSLVCHVESAVVRHRGYRSVQAISVLTSLLLLNSMRALEPSFALH